MGRLKEMVKWAVALVAALVAVALWAFSAARSKAKDEQEVGRDKAEADAVRKAGKSGKADEVLDSFDKATKDGKK